MKTKNKTGLLTMLLTSATLLTFMGTVAGSVAWFAYNTRVTASYQGTAVSSSEQLQIGIETDRDLESVGLTTELVGGVNYAWSPAGTGIDYAAISYYLSLEGYATNKLAPVSSNEYTNGDTLTLTDTLVYAHPQNNRAADHIDYVKIPFVFRIIRSSMVIGEPDYFAKNENIWITDAVAEARDVLEDGEIYKAIRVHFDGENKFILNPSAEGAASYTNVGGLLDLNRDGYYDYDGSTKNEYVYGSVSNESAARTNFPSSTDLVNVNGLSGITPSTEQSTFYSRHYEGTHGYNNLNTLSPLHANYETLDSIAPNDDGTGLLTLGTPIAVTENNEDALAHCTVTIFLEGWDHSVIDAEITHEFNVGLQFQINRIA